MKSLFQLAAELERLFMERKWKYCFIGGIPLQRWGEPRLTTDIDVTLLTGLGSEESFIDALLDQYPGRVENAREFAVKYRVLLLESPEKIGIDIALGALPFEEEVVKRATRFGFLPGLELLTCSAEDLIIMKACANRQRDWADVKGILIRQWGRLDWNYVQRQIKPICELKDSPEIINRLNQMHSAIKDKP